jgi:hypothetical protein
MSQFVNPSISHPPATNRVTHISSDLRKLRMAFREALVPVGIVIQFLQPPSGQLILLLGWELRNLIENLLK